MVVIKFKSCCWLRFKIICSRKSEAFLWNWSCGREGSEKEINCLLIYSTNDINLWYRHKQIVIINSDDDKNNSIQCSTFPPHSVNQREQREIATKALEEVSEKETKSSLWLRSMRTVHRNWWKALQQKHKKKSNPPPPQKKLSQEDSTCAVISRASQPASQQWNTEAQYKEQYISAVQCLLEWKWNKPFVALLRFLK